MATSFDAINTIFYDLVESDCDFFNYYGVAPEVARALAEQRADSCLMQAATKLSVRHQTPINFADFDATERSFAADMTSQEILLLAHLAYEQYLFRDFATLRANATRFTSSEQSVFSPANDRKTFLSMYETLRGENEDMVNRYLSRDRISGEYKYISYTD